MSTYKKNGIPPKGCAYVGVATVDTMVNEEVKFGKKFGSHRAYFKADKVDKAVATAQDDVLNNRLPWLSFKLPLSWSDMAAGKGDSWAEDLANKLGSVPGPVWIAMHHEPENDGPIKDWVSMQKRLAPIFKKKENLAYTIILTGWQQLYPSNPELSMDNAWPGKEYVDIIGIDPYNWYSTANRTTGVKTYSWTELKQYYEKLVEWLAKSGNEDVSWAVAETGLPDEAAATPMNYVASNKKVVATSGPGKEWIQRATTDLIEMGGVMLNYFDVPPTTNSEPPSWSWPLKKKKKKADFVSAVSKTSFFNVLQQDSIAIGKYSQQGIELDREIAGLKNTIAQLNNKLYRA